MNTKTLLAHFKECWPDAEFKDEAEVMSDESFALSARHRELLEREIEACEQKEMFLFIQRGLSLEVLEQIAKEFLQSNDLEIYPAPPTPMMLGLENEKVFLALEDFEQKLGSVYHLIYYPASGLCIVYTYFGQLHWYPQ